MIVLGLSFGTSVVMQPTAGAINVFDACDGQDSKVCKESKTESINDPVQSVVGLLLFAIGTISVIMIIVGGIRYVISNGEAARIKSAKDTILYAVIGLIVSLLAYAIVNFVLNQFG